MAERTLTQADNGSTVQVRRGDRLFIRLPENPTTGYRWAVDGVDDRIVTPVASEFGAAGGGAGAGGSATLAFEARDVGEGSIQLKRWRDWEGETSVRERYAVTVSVR